LTPGQAEDVRIGRGEAMADAERRWFSKIDSRSGLD
jgi:hypothetical protein